jgi:hypothetical protein
MIYFLHGFEIVLKKKKSLQGRQAMNPKRSTNFCEPLHSNSFHSTLLSLTQNRTLAKPRRATKFKKQQKFA